MRKILLILTLAACSFAQTTTINGSRSITGTWDASGATATLPFKIGTTLPESCSTGQVFYKSDATAGQQVYTCLGGTWTRLAQVQSGADLPETCSGGDLFFLTTAGTGTRLHLCDDTDTWHYIVSVSGSGVGVWTFLEGTAPGAGLSTGEHNVYFDSADSLLKSHENGGSVVTYTRTIAAGTATLGTSSISSGACASTVTVSATGVATTDVIVWTPNADITAVNGYVPSTSGGLSIYPYPTANNVNFKVCNSTADSITPGAVTLNWRVVR